MATQTFSPEWVDVYGSRRKIRSGTPYQMGGSSQYHTFIKVPNSVKNAINSSSSSPKLHMIVNFTSGASELDIGHHRERNSRSNGASGIPWYGYNETWRNTGTGTRTYEMSNWFMPQIMDGNYQGLVLYSFNGTHSATANSIQFRVTGTWNRPPSNPSNVRVDKSSADRTQTVRWGASSDPDGDTVRYDIEFYNGSSWTRMVNSTTNRSWTMTTSSQRETTRARYRVRAVDGKEATAWQNTPYFTIDHVPPTFSSSQISYQDVNSTTVGITGNNQHIIQSASRPRAYVNSSASANDGKTIRRYIFTLSGQERTRTSTGSVNFNEIDAQSNQTLRVTAEDSEGLRTTVSIPVEIIPYEKPEIRYNAKRVGSIEDETVLEVSGSISLLDGKNSLQTTRYRYRQTGGNYTTWRTLNRSVSGNNFTASNVTLDLSADNEWEIQIQVTDRVSSRNVYVQVRRGRPIMFLDEQNDRMGIGKFPERGHLDIDGQVYFLGRAIAQVVGDDGDAFRIEGNYPDGHGYLSYFGSDGERKGYVGFGARNTKNFQIENEQGGHMDLNTTGSGEVRVNGENIQAESGTFTGGAWVRFADGTAIAWKENITVTYSSATILDYRWNLPIQMLSSPRPATLVTKNEYTGAGSIRDGTTGGYTNNSGGRTTYTDVLLMAGGGTTFNSGFSTTVRVMVIGRWK